MTRLPGRIPVLDACLGGALVLVTVVGQAADRTLPQPWVTLVAGLWSASVLLRTVAPFAMAVSWSACAVAYVVLPTHSTVLGTFLALLVVVFSAGERLTGRRLLAALLLMVGAMYVVQVTTAHRPGGDTDFGDVYLSPLALLLPAAGGVLLARSRRQSAELARLGRELAAEREAHARAAAAEERNRIARELHDVISHSVGVMVVQAGAAEQLLDPDSPARPPLQAVRRTGKEALTELRRQLGVLRAEAPASPSPLPVLADVRSLAADDDVTLELDEDVAEVPPGMALTAYRVVQEALTNARRHAAGAPVRVRVAREGDELDVDVRNGPGRPRDDAVGGGHGLVGMRERVELYSGRLEAGATDDGGWRVRARMPMPAPGQAG